MPVRLATVHSEPTAIALYSVSPPVVITVVEKRLCIVIRQLIVISFSKNDIVSLHGGWIFQRYTDGFFVNELTRNLNGLIAGQIYVTVAVPYLHCTGKFKSAVHIHACTFAGDIVGVNLRGFIDTTHFESTVASHIHAAAVDSFVAGVTANGAVGHNECTVIVYAAAIVLSNVTVNRTVVHGEGALFHIDTATVNRLIAAYGTAVHGEGAIVIDSNAATTVQGIIGNLIVTNGTSGHGEGAAPHTDTATHCACCVAAYGTAAHGKGTGTAHHHAASASAARIATDDTAVHGKGTAHLHAETLFPVAVSDNTVAVTIGQCEVDAFGDVNRIVLCINFNAVTVETEHGTVRRLPCRSQRHIVRQVIISFFHGIVQSRNARPIRQIGMAPAILTGCATDRVWFVGLHVQIECCVIFTFCYLITVVRVGDKALYVIVGRGITAADSNLNGVLIRGHTTCKFTYTDAACTTGQ